jgi:predicted  nucleic acid-binding Zn-ribbon protein
MDLTPVIALQQLDARLHVLRRRREDVPRSLAAAEERLARAKADREAFVAAQKGGRVEIDRRELDLKTLEGRIEKLEGQLNTIKTNKEYALLKKEIDGLKADKGVIDDEILQAMMAHEEKDKEGQAYAEAVKAAETALDGERKQAEASIAEIDREVAALQAERDAASGKVDVDVLRTYERILNGKRDRVAIVPVEVSGSSGVCQGCYVDITSHEINLLLIGRDVRTCKSCSRILYIDPASASALTKGKGKAPAEA